MLPSRTTPDGSINGKVPRTATHLRYVGNRWALYGLRLTFLLIVQLLAKDDGYKEPIATFKKSQRNLGEDLPAEPARLTLTARAVEVQDTVVLSFLFLERLRRGQARTEQSTADALTKQPIVAITSGHGYGAGGG